MEGAEPSLGIVGAVAALLALLLFVAMQHQPTAVRLNLEIPGIESGQLREHHNLVARFFQINRWIPVAQEGRKLSAPALCIGGPAPHPVQPPIYRLVNSGAQPSNSFSTRRFSRFLICRHD